jgi:bifunctional non-homologous end joining protein LigD
MPRDQLGTYRSKRDFGRTSEPSGESAASVDGAPAPRFVVQEHHARRLHWDLRLEQDGVLASWAVPNGIPQDPKENRLAVRTEDHPLEYLEFEGEIPKGEYGAGTMRIWDRGTYETHKWEDKKVEVTFAGERLRGRYGLFPLDGNDWMIHRMDPPIDPGRVAMPEHLVPMLARPGHLPADESGWSFEIKWDGVRALAYAQPGRLRLESRNLRDITDSYPEVRGLLRDLGMRDAILDGELVAFDERGRPNFGLLQRRMHVTSASSVRRLSAEIPVVYAIFDVLFLDGHPVIEETYERRRALLEGLGLSGPAWRVPAVHAGDGARLLAATREQGLEGIVAKRIDSRYEPGRRSGAWQKIKHTLRQELVIGGWLPGEGRRTDRIGALLMGLREGSALRYAGRVGTGFTDATLDDLSARLAPLRRSESPFAPTADGAPPVRFPREAQFVEPKLVAEVEFTEWTGDGVMRAPSFKGLREDKEATEVTLELDAPERLFDSVERNADGSLNVVVDGRRLKLTNWDKVLFGKTGFTKGDLIAYHARIAPVLVPHLRDRLLTLKRYPNGVQEQYFYEKQSPRHRPDWIPTARMGSVDYTLAQERAALVWLGNLADIELHTSLALASDLEKPTMIVFDLDPGEPAGLVECCEVALVINGLFAQLRLGTVVKTSGSKGMQVYLPLNSGVEYSRAKLFAKQVAELLEQRLPELVVSRMTKKLRPGKVLVDWSQNDRNKTTVNVYSIRARERPIVSAPLSWDEVESCRRTGDPASITFEASEVVARVEEYGDLFAPALSLVQELPAI